MCGIAGIISPEPRKFDFVTFCTLGIHNDSRGKDSVGIFIDGKTEYYCEGKRSSLFEDFMETSELIQNTETAQICYLHCRAASVGDVNKETAQPVVIYNNDKKIDYVLMHNGTIYNYKELAKKYIPDVNIDKMTDSQVMARIFYNSGYKALEEYNGAAVFAIIDYRDNEPKFLFWQGKSKKYTYNDTVDLERPLNFVLTKSGELVFSSEYTFLSALRPGCKDFRIEPNILTIFTKGNEGLNLYEYEVHDRLTKSQVEITTTCYTTYPNYYTSNPNAGNNRTNTPSTTNNNPYYNNSYVIGSSLDGKCSAGGKLLHGKFKISDYGRLVKEEEEGNEIYFWNGIVLKNQAAFLFLTKFMHEYDCKTPQDLEDNCIDLILYLSPYPFYKVNEGSVKVLVNVTSPVGGHNFSGEMIYPFTCAKNFYINGIYQRTLVTNTHESLNAWRAHKSDELDYAVLTNY